MESNSTTDGPLLDNVSVMDQPQYLIQRIPENSQLLSSELLQNPNLVVDIGNGDFIPVYNSSEDLLPQELTEEDRNLAEALVAVQLSQQQKLQHVSNTSLGGKEDSQIILTDKNGGYLQIVGPDTNLYIESKDHLPKLLQSRFSNIVTTSEAQGGHQLIPVKIEDDGDKRESDTDKTDTRSLKKSLPHKKRISRKLKKNPATVTRKIKCNLCEQHFPTSDDFNRHSQICQTTITPIINNAQTQFSCQLCLTAFNDQLSFFEHLKAHYESPKSSATCAPSIRQAQNFENEEDPDQPETRPDTPPVKETEPNTSKESILSSLLNLTCVTCNKTFRKQKTYEAHMREVHGKYDLNEFSEPEDLMEGINVVVDTKSEIDDVEDTKMWYGEEEIHQTEEDLKELESDDHICHICKQPFPLRAILLQHLISCREVTGKTEPTAPAIVKKKNKKTKATSLSCTICERTFTHRNSLMYHLHSHTGIRPHQCHTCGKSFFASSALKVHLRLHSGDKPYVCKECGRKFRQWGDLKYHMTSLHSDEKQFQCEYCGKEFARKYSLVVHRRIHTGEKNYRCEFCGKCFRASSYLQNHRRIHTGEKPHECDVCGKPFRVRSDMKRHQKSHLKKTMRKVYTTDQTTQKTEKIDIDATSNDTADLQINDGENESEILYDTVDPLANPGRDTNTLYTNGHQLFLVSYSGDVTKMESGWIQSSS